MEHLERRVVELEREHKESVQCFDDGLGDVEEGIIDLERRLGFRRGSGGKTGDGGGGYDAPPRAHPEPVTVEALPDDGEVYSEALPLVAEWRRALRALDSPPHTMAWLKATERLLRLEIQLIDDRRLTLLPDESPWDDVRRANELQLREHRLRQLRHERLWAELLHLTARLVTLGRFGGEEELGRRMQREYEARRAEVLSSDREHRDGKARN